MTMTEEDRTPLNVEGEVSASTETEDVEAMTSGS